MYYLTIVFGKIQENYLQVNFCIFFLGCSPLSHFLIIENKTKLLAPDGSEGNIVFLPISAIVVLQN